MEGYGSQNKPSLASLDEEARYRRLLHRYREMGVGNQQCQYEHAITERKMAIARTALEAIANGETDPGVRKLARETLDGFNVLSDAEQFMGFFLGVQQGDAIASVWSRRRDQASDEKGRLPFTSRVYPSRTE